MASAHDDAPREFEQWDDDRDDYGDPDDPDCEPCTECSDRLENLSSRTSAVSASWRCPQCGPVTFKKDALPQPPPPSRAEVAGQTVANVVFCLCVAAVFVAGFVGVTNKFSFLK